MPPPTRSTSPTASATAASSCFDATTGAYKRHWGAYGAAARRCDRRRVRSGRAAREAVPHGELRRDVASDGIVYVCDRQNNRIQVFRKDGTFVKEAVVSKDDARRRLGVGHRVLARSAAAVPLRRRRAGPEGVDPASATSLDVSRASASGGRWPGHFYASAASPSIRRATSTRARRSRASACRSSCSRR